MIQIPSKTLPRRRIGRKPMDRLQIELDTIRRDLAELRPLVATDDVTGAYFIERVELALESMAGCILLAKAGLAFPLGILARSLLEMNMGTFWAASMPERAVDASGATAAEAIRNMKKLLVQGHGKIVNTKTGEDQTAMLLEAIEKKKPGPRKQIAEMARECGLGRLYERFYGIESMPAHGHNIGLTGNDADNKAIFATMSASKAHLKAIHFTAAKWIRRDGEATTLAELDAILKTGLVPPPE